MLVVRKRERFTVDFRVKLTWERKDWKQATRRSETKQFPNGLRRYRIIIIINFDLLYRRLCTCLWRYLLRRWHWKLVSERSLT